MKVLLDANVCLSFLLAPTAHTRTVTAVVVACLTSDAIDLLIPPELITEILTKVSTKRYLLAHVPPAVTETLITQLAALAEQSPPLEEIARVSRDPKDDYLIAYGIVYEADYLITGDNDLLALGSVGALQIVTPGAFLDILAHA